MSLQDAATLLEVFRCESLRSTIARLECDCEARSIPHLDELLMRGGVSEALLSAALLMKWHSRQINEIVHAAGILLALPKILEPGEQVESVSLGAGNTGRGFDLCTDRRVAEFTFISWQGGPEVIRQNKIFKDFYFLAETDTGKRKELYTIGTALPLKFFESERGLSAILKGNRKLGDSFTAKYGTQFRAVRDYFNFRRSEVALCDVGQYVPLFHTPLAAAATAATEGSPSKADDTE